MSFDHLSGTTNFPPLIEAEQDDSSYLLTNLHPTIEEDQYCRAIDRILEYIAAGDTYQVNYTLAKGFLYLLKYTGFNLVARIFRGTVS